MKAGRQEIWPTEESCIEDIETYKELLKISKDKDFPDHIPLVNNFCAWKGMSRQCFYNYENKLDIVKDFKNFLESEFNLWSLANKFNASIAKLNLNHHYNYREKQEIIQESTIVTLSKEERERRINELLKRKQC